MPTNRGQKFGIVTVSLCRSLEKRVMNLTAFLDKVIQGDAKAVAGALEAQPELLDAKGEGKPLFSSANALWVYGLTPNPAKSGGSSINAPFTIFSTREMSLAG
jgi:hypothetical protein